MTESQQYCSVVRFEWCCKVLFVVLPKYNRFWTVFLNMHLISVQKVSFKLCGGWRESIEWQRLYRFFPHWENKDPLQTLSVRKKSTGLRLLHVKSSKRLCRKHPRFISPFQYLLRVHTQNGTHFFLTSSEG